MGAVSDPLLSIVSGTRNRPEFVARFVWSVLEHVTVPFELLIGDASDGGSFFESPDPRVHVYPERVRLGPPRGYNALFRRARGAWVCYLNDDLEIGAGWSEAVVAALARHPEADLFCLPMLEPGEPGPIILLYQQLPYANMGMVRREAGDALGWFDEGYRFYATDVDLAMRAIASGYRIAPAIGAHVFHHHLPDEERVGNQDFLDGDNERLRRTWRPRRKELRRRYRRTSFRHFRGLGTRACPNYHCDAIDVPLDPAARTRPRQPHRVKAYGWWLGI